MEQPGMPQEQVNGLVHQEEFNVSTGDCYPPGQPQVTGWRKIIERNEENLSKANFTSFV